VKKNSQAIVEARKKKQRLYDACEEFFEADPNCTLPDALRMAAEREQNAA
jgi:hypothetical protein